MASASSAPADCLAHTSLYNGATPGSVKLPVNLDNLCSVSMSALTEAFSSQPKSATESAIAASLEGLTAKTESQDCRINGLEQHLSVYTVAAYFR